MTYIRVKQISYTFVSWTKFVATKKIEFPLKFLAIIKSERLKLHR